jgi:hypothetical protein
MVFIWFYSTTPKDSNGFLSISIVSYGTMWIPIDSYGFLGICNFAWIPHIM